jgi:hypothetical protein
MLYIQSKRLSDYAEWNPTQAHKSLYGDKCRGRECPLKEKCHFGRKRKGWIIRERFDGEECYNFEKALDDSYYDPPIKSENENKLNKK